MPPVIIPIFLPRLGCHEHCLFCNQKTDSQGLPSPSAVKNLIENSLVGIPEDKKNREKQIAFYGGSFTAIPEGDQLQYLKTVQPFLSDGLIDSIRISTRPDALNEEIVSLLKEYGVKTVEIGVQSMIDEVLFLSRRGHDAEDTVHATRRLNQQGFEVGLQLMIGLPEDSCDRFLQTLDRVIELNPHFVRIHPTLVLKGAPLETLWREGRYLPLSLEEAIGWLKKGILKLEKSSVTVSRIGLQPSRELERDYLAGPYHPAIHQLVDSSIFFDMAASLLRTSQKNGRALFLCHPKEFSNLRGQRNENILRLRKQFRLREVFIEGRQGYPRGDLGLQIQKGEITIRRTSLVF